ncbi:hypothetical protein Ga0061061_11641 [Chelatococcus sambhunathii]|uniref:Phage DNA packaging protein, Nu1 subunit of terminase n=1 Tax=Chelatococcus sambhunathii TaxID=363953 RepID=A0ABM9UHN6_9HYPH|nr:hypothetical protein [Chelatococcus sambhunathii]CUA90900.1 hypothetical protein Ga0061061_11641 [Chelatococcus sambhunathii]
MPKGVPKQASTGKLPERLTAGDMARVLALTTERLRQLSREGAIPKSIRGAYPAEETIRGYVAWLRDEDRRSTKSAGESAVRRARARQIELRTARDQRELVPWQEATAYTQEIVGMLIARMQGLPAQVTRDPALRSKIEDAIDAIRTDVADRAAELEKGLGDSQDPDPADDEADT